MHITVATITVISVRSILIYHCCNLAQLRSNFQNSLLNLTSTRNARKRWFWFHKTRKRVLRDNTVVIIFPITARFLSWISHETVQRKRERERERERDEATTSSRGRLKSFSLRGQTDARHPTMNSFAPLMKFKAVVTPLAQRQRTRRPPRRRCRRGGEGRRWCTGNAARHSRTLFDTARPSTRVSKMFDVLFIICLYHHLLNLFFSRSCLLRFRNGGPLGRGKTYSPSRVEMRFPRLSEGRKFLIQRFDAAKFLGILRQRLTEID